MNKYKVAFICVHNSCRSQIAEALAREYAKDVILAFSAGTEIKSEINQDAVRMMKKLFNIDMNKFQYSKKIEDIPNPDIVITMGCNVSCPAIPCSYSEDWGLDDPTGQSDEVFTEVIMEIMEKVESLRERLLRKSL
ncbi:arsenate reductase ArsC [Anaerovorax odorimutans]|uniref:arsenate reductase ArsC n=1 Tax=Anaerovorax odorimutans TaxID=109327 RepID=UPI000428F2CF|nr:arsenate reductase ArsC [Anaerovorax odorimutans]